MSKTIYVYETFSSQKSEIMGYLYIDFSRGSEHHSFEFDNNWLKSHSCKFTLDPELYFTQGRQYPAGKPTFGIFSDASPDRWGRVLMERKERFTADKESRKPKKLNSGDYLLGVYDESRMGALRFKSEASGDFLSYDKETSVPPWTALRTLEEASRNFENEETTLQEKWLNQLIRPGSSLGGARPKATVKNPDGELWIAKFPSRKDDYNIGAWEKTANDLAVLCGLNVPQTRLENFSKLGSTFLVKRFDRNGTKRIHFASAMTMLGKTDGASSDDGTSYLDIVSFIKSNGANPKKDLLELWKRIVFNMAITNSDDHLRNHGFLLRKDGWHLSPIYDINPVPYGDTLALNIDNISNEISLELAVESAHYYCILKKDAVSIAADIIDTIKNNWEKTALSNGLTHAAIENMRPAFNLCK